MRIKELNERNDTGGLGKRQTVDIMGKMTAILRKMEKLKSNLAHEIHIFKNEGEDDSFEFRYGFSQGSRLEKIYQQLSAEIKKIQGEIRAHQAEIAKEKTLKVNADKLAKFKKSLDTECSQYVAAIKTAGKLLYRIERYSEDMDDSHRYVFAATTPTDRKPRDSSKHYSDLLDRKLAKSGFTALRKNSIFATANIKMLLKYYTYNGDAYIIFPKDGFGFTWSKKYDDLIVSYEEMPKVSEFVKNADLAGAIKSDHEVWITGEYYALQVQVFGKYMKEWYDVNVTLWQGEDEDVAFDPDTYERDDDGAEPWFK